MNNTSFISLLVVGLVIFVSCSFYPASAMIPSSNLRDYYQWNQTVGIATTDNCQYTGSPNCDNSNMGATGAIFCQFLGLIDLSCEWASGNAVGHLGLLPVFSTGSNYTINGWVNELGHGRTNDLLISRHQTTNQAGMGFALNTDESVSFALFSNDVVPVVDIGVTTASNVLGNVGSWQMVTVTVNQTNGINYAKIYVNGTKLAEQSFAGTLPAPYGTQGQFAVGNAIGGQATCSCTVELLGNLDEWSFWRGELPQANVTRQFNNGVGLDMVHASLTPPNASVATGGQLPSLFRTSVQSVVWQEVYSIANNPSNPNNACTTQIQLLNYSTLLQTTQFNHCFNSTTDFTPAPQISFTYPNTPSVSKFSIVTYWNKPVIDLNFSPTITNTTTGSHNSAMITQNNSTTIAGGSSSFQPTPPPVQQETPVPPSMNPVQSTGAAPSNDILSNVIDTLQKLLGLKKAGFTLDVANKFYQLQADSLVNDKVNVRWNTADDLAISSITVGDSPMMIQVPKTPFKLTGGYSQSSSGNIPIILNIPNECSKTQDRIFTGCVEVKDYKIPLTITGTTASGATATKTGTIEIDLTNIDLVYAGIFVFAGIGAVGSVRILTRRRRILREYGIGKNPSTSNKKNDTRRLLGGSK